MLTVAIALVGIVLALRAVPQRASTRADRDPLDERLGPLAPVLGNAYYFDAAIVALVDGPLPPRPRFLTGDVDHKSSTAR